ncbi:MAG TPA: biliverdin-producing heme oxygenase [Polyangiaceae bacterium]|nr:biliverdin-producing heme oxygenase [Polyangiaceae bacterium]
MTHSLMERLRAETHEAHEAIERLPYFEALRQRTLPLSAYANYLRAFSLLHEALEDALGLAQGVSAAVWQAGMSKRPLLARDLAELGAEGPEVPKAEARAIALAEQLRARAAEDPAWALGYLYVLEGSTLGNRLLRRELAGLPSLAGGRGLHYVSSYGEQTGEHWRAFASRMDGLVLEAETRDRMAAVARDAFEGIASVIEAIYPPAPEEWAALVRALNPKAGDHPVTSDPAELRAALRAGERTWHNFPYYELRFGPDGRRFMRSDSGWLAHLTERPPAELERQVAWLGGVLANRGMPQWLLECHLEDLFVELARVRPEQRTRYEPLRHASAALRRARAARVDEGTFERLGAAFDAAVGPEWRRKLPRCGGLVVSAAADEANGHPRAVSSLVDWLGSPERFPPVWVEAVRQTLDAARRAVTPL